MTPMQRFFNEKWLSTNSSGHLRVLLAVNASLNGTIREDFRKTLQKQILIPILSYEDTAVYSQKLERLYSIIPQPYADSRTADIKTDHLLDSVATEKKVSNYVRLCVRQKVPDPASRIWVEMSRLFIIEVRYQMISGPTGYHFVIKMSS